MGQKVNPHGARVGVIKAWDTRWYADKDKFSDYLIEDCKIRECIKSLNIKNSKEDEKANVALAEARIAKVTIERAGGKVAVSIHTARPGMVIGKNGYGVEQIRAELNKLTGRPVAVNVVEIRNADVDAQLVAEDIAAQLTHRVSYRRALKQAISRSMKAGALGIRTKVSGRLGGAEIARSDGYHEGSIPLQTLRADIDYGFAEASTTYGKIGVKVWIYKGQVLPTKKNLAAKGGIR